MEAALPFPLCFFDLGFFWERVPYFEEKYSYTPSHKAWFLSSTVSASWTVGTTVLESSLSASSHSSAVLGQLNGAFVMVGLGRLVPGSGLVTGGWIGHWESG